MTLLTRLNQLVRVPINAGLDDLEALFDKEEASQEGTKDAKAQITTKSQLDST